MTRYYICIFRSVNKKCIVCFKTFHGVLRAFVKRTTFEADRALEPEPRSRYVPACYPAVFGGQRGKRR